MLTTQQAQKYLLHPAVHEAADNFKCKNWDSLNTSVLEKLRSWTGVTWSWGAASRPQH